MKRIYLDNAATTPCAPEVLEAMLPCFTQVYGNASSVHAWGREAKRSVEAARRQVQKCLNAAIPQEILFTAGGSESDNWAIKGAAFAHADRGRHIITTAIEHHAVLHACQWLEKLGFEVTESKANFLFARHPEISGEELYRQLKERGILIRHFGAERIRDYNRISVGTDEQMDALIRETEQVLRG